MSAVNPLRGTPGRVLLRLAARFAPAARERVFVPLLADFQFEYRQAASRSTRLGVRLKWILAFAHTLGLEVAAASVAHLRVNAWGATEEERSATGRLLACVAGATIASAVALMLDMLVHPVVGRHGHQGLLLPGVLCVALPAASLVGVVLAAGRRPWVAPWRPLLGVAGLAGIATFALAAWITPKANQSYRERVFASLAASEGGVRAPLRRGDRELTLAELGGRASGLRDAGQRAAAGRLDLEWHKKPALGGSCLALALAGAAVVRRLRRRAYRWAASLLVLVGWFWLLRLGEQAADAGAIAPALATWGPCVAAAALGLGALGRRSPRRPPAAA